MELLGYVAPVSSCIFDTSVKLDERVVKKKKMFGGIDRNFEKWPCWEEKTAKASLQWN